jgi:hypothetical protein
VRGNDVRYRGTPPSQPFGKCRSLTGRAGAERRRTSTPARGLVRENIHLPERDGAAPHRPGHRVDGT